ncbi:MAG TPA: PLP-dependent aminotransferase family protein [Solirubrobacteraceae bacterium]|jgi:2-aminoadipate transaminase|nr:PLP-dependent aminotransferase family protein [Solirubrobacteraceae bacterium]
MSNVAESLADRLAAVERDAKPSLTRQLANVFAAAIAGGELEPGAKLPTTRELARLASVNQLTAGRCYRLLQEQGLVVSVVGRGTFVRTAAAGAGDEADPSWQTYALAPPRGGYAGRVLGESVRHANSGELIAMSIGYPSSEQIPLVELDEAVRETLATKALASFEYCPIEGTDELRTELARLGRTRGMDDDADGILVTTGARHGLTLVTRAILRPGDVAACESPTFMGIIESLRATGATVMPVDVDEHGFNVDALEQLLRSHEVRLVALQPRGHNPTGTDLSPERRERLLALARRHGFFVLEDAVYADLRYDGEDHRPLRAMDRAHVVYVDSLSKTVAPGLRAGWVAASGPVLDRIIAEKRDDDAHCATLPQLVAARFLADGRYPSQLDGACRLYRERRDALLEALETELSGLASFPCPRGGGHVWVTLERACDDQQLYDSALAAGVSYIPGPAMLVDAPRATHLRLSFTSLTPERLREGVRRLAATIRAQPQAPRQRHTLPVV